MSLKIFFFVLFLSGFLFPQKSPGNIIILIGDGMDLDFVTADVLMDKDNPFKRFSSLGLSLTSSADNLITDSGAGATAIATGYRTYNHAISDDLSQKPLTTIFEIAERLNKSTGVVVTSSVTHATPAAFFSHSTDRKYETRIASQIVNSGAEVVIGAGLEFFTPSDKQGKRTDGHDLTDSIKNKGYLLFKTWDELKKYDGMKPFYALLEPEAIKPASERNYSLGDLLSAALKNVSRDKDGFVIMVEGSQIDWGAHDHKTEYMLGELKDFAGAVNTALDFAEKNKNTLVLVTSDHETGGASITGGNPDGSDLQISYTSGGHTAGMVGIFAKGPGEEQFRGIMKNQDIGRKLIHLIQPGYKFQ